MEHAAKSFLTALRRIAGEEKPLDFLAAVWPLIVGARLSEHTRPVLWEKGRVEVAVDDREWQKQLEHMDRELVAKINRYWGRQVVSEVSFVRGRAGRAAARAVPKPPAEKKGAAGSQEDRVDLLKELEQSFARIKDTQLRKLVARVANRYLQAQKPK